MNQHKTGKSITRMMNDRILSSIIQMTLSSQNGMTRLQDFDTDCPEDSDLHIPS